MLPEVDRLYEVRNRSINNLVEILLQHEIAKVKQNGELAL